MSTDQEFIDAQMLKLQGKDYLPVAPRVVLFRKEHPEWSIMTDCVEKAGANYMYCQIANETGRIVATAHKRIRTDGKGPAAIFPVESAETGAIGRALGLCGYGTLSGDLDEGEDIADAPVETTKKSKKAPVNPLPKEFDVVYALDSAKTKEQFDKAHDQALAALKTLVKDSPEWVAICQAGTRARNRIAAK